MNYEEVKNKTFLRQGIDAGVRGENFYVILPNNVIYELPPAVYYIWSNLDGERTLEKTIMDCSAELQINMEELVEPFLAILEKLIEVNLAIEKT